MSLFDFFTQFGKGNEIDIPEKKEESFAPPNIDDAIVINSGGVVGHSLFFANEGNTNEDELIDSWRELATRPEIDWAVQEIVNEAIVTDYIDYPVSLEIPESSELPEKITKRLRDEFDTVLGLMDFNRTSSDKFRQWYIDGKHYYHGIVDSKNPSRGLIGIRWIDPKTIKKVVETEKIKNPNGIEIERIKDIFYVYSTNLSGKPSFARRNIGAVQQTIKVHPDAIAYANSGIFREKTDGTTFAISHLDKSLKVANQLKLLEDDLVIYRHARAPERRVFYVDVGTLSKTKAEQYVQAVMNRFRNKITYDTNTGEIKDQRNTLSMLEDFWLPRREGGRGTEVTTLPGGQGLGELDDVNYFYKKLFRALNIPSTRFSGDSTFNLGRSAEITREEVKFSKFINYLRSKFSETFIQLLKIQVVTKKIMKDSEFDELSASLTFKWKSDSYWDELMFNEMMQSRSNLLQQLEPYVGKYFSQEWIKKNVLSLSDDDIKDMDSQIKKEIASGQMDEPNDKEDDSYSGRGF